MRISYSSSTLFQGCNRKYWHKKVRKTPIDPDCEEDTTALRVGKCFHQILEDSGHVQERVSKAIVMKAFGDNDILETGQKAMILAMVEKYLILHKKQGLKVVVCEIKIGDKDLIGFVDAIMIDSEGGWYIVDLKTAGMLNNSLLARLAMDPQLNIYSHYVKQIALQLRLDKDKFMGTRYRVTTKAKIKMSKKETFKEYKQRCFDRIESYDIFVPVEDLQPEKTHRTFMRLKESMDQCAELMEDKVPQNFGFCEQYFKPCEYWSRCYGKTFSSASEDHQLVDSTNATEVIGDDDLALL